ncbi:MAG: hypothetical protein ACREBD_35665, partial [Blastocatellia bacterium]
GQTGQDAGDGGRAVDGGARAGVARQIRPDSEMLAKQKDVRQKNGDSYFSVLHLSIWPLGGIE